MRVGKISKSELSLKAGLKASDFLKCTFCCQVVDLVTGPSLWYHVLSHGPLYVLTNGF